VCKECKSKRLEQCLLPVTMVAYGRSAPKSERNVALGVRGNSGHDNAFMGIRGLLSEQHSWAHGTTSIHSFFWILVRITCNRALEKWKHVEMEVQAPPIAYDDFLKMREHSQIEDCLP